MLTGSSSGDRGSVHLKEGAASGTGHGDGPGIKNEGMGEDQRPVQPNKIGKAFNDMKSVPFLAVKEMSLLTSDTGTATRLESDHNPSKFSGESPR